MNCQDRLTPLDREHMHAGAAVANEFRLAIAMASEIRPPEERALWWSGLFAALAGMASSSIGPDEVAMIAKEMREGMEQLLREAAH